MKEYELDLPEATAAIAVCTPAPGHRALVKALQQLPSLEYIKLATTRGEEGGSYLTSRGVYGPDGARLHDDHEAWLRQEVEADYGDVRATFYRLKDKGYKLSKRHVATLYLTVDQGGDQANFLQLEVWREQERMDCRLFKEWGSTPSDTEDLVRDADGYELPEVEQVPVAPARYSLRRAVDVGRFVQVVEQLDEAARATLRGRVYALTDDEGKEERRTHAQLDPDFDRFPCKVRRLFADWDASSAGRSGQRLCDHWVMEFHDWTNPQTGERAAGLVPQWTFGQKLAEVDANKGELHAFFGKLQTLDRRVKVPFGWYFYMLHGNRVNDSAGRRVLKAAEDGLIVLPEHDYQVLRAWRQRSYGF